LLETISLVKMDFLASLSSALFGHVLNTVSEGVLSHESSIQNACGVYLDAFLSYVFRLVRKKNAPNAVMSNINDYAGVFRQILINLLNGIIFAESK
jgi:hypothetical protein